MNIAHFEDEPWDSGLARYALTLAEEQARRGHRVAVWGRTGSPVLRQAERAGLAARGWTPGLDLLAEFVALRRELAAFAPRVIDAHTGSAHALACLLAPRGAVVIRTRADARPPRPNFASRRLAARTAAFVAANSALRGQLAAAFPGRPVRLVPQGLRGPQEPAPMPGAPYVGMIARLDPVKGHDVLIDAARLLQPAVPGLKVLCAGEGRLLDRLGWQLEPLGLAGTVRLLGRVEDKWAFLSGCRIGVVASSGSEAVSRAALEWMAAARPLVATRVGGIPDLVEDGVTGLLVPAGRPAALAEALKSLLDAPPRAEAMGAAARARWQHLFSPEPFYRETQKVYEEALDSAAR